MPLKRCDKEVIVKNLHNVARDAVSMVAFDYSGTPAVNMTEVRAEARTAGVKMQIARNTLTQRAIAGTDFECIDEHLTGPLMLAFSMDEPGSAARVLKSFIKDNPNIEVKLISMSGDVLPAASLDAVASLPSKDEGIAMLLSVMKAPITKFVATCQAPHLKLVRTLVAIKEKKEQSAG